MMKTMLLERLRMFSIALIAALTLLAPGAGHAGTVYVDAASSNRAKRGAMSVARFKIIGQLVWDSVNGRQDEVWENQAD